MDNSSKVAIGMICDSYVCKNTLISSLNTISQVYWDSIRYYYLCSGFRILDLATLEMNDYSIKDVMGLTDIKGINYFDESDIVNDRLPLNIFGCTDRFTRDNFIDSDGKFDVPIFIDRLPIVKTNLSSSFRAFIKSKDKLIKSIARIVCEGSYFDIFVDVNTKNIEVALFKYENTVYSSKYPWVCDMLNLYIGADIYEVIHLNSSQGFGLYKDIASGIASFNDSIAVNLGNSNISCDIIVPDCYKNLRIISSFLDYSKKKVYKIVIPTSLNNIKFIGKKYFKDMNVVLYIPKSRIDLVYKAYKDIFDYSIGSGLSILKSKLTKTGYNDIVNYMMQKHNISIELY